MAADMVVSLVALVIMGSMAAAQALRRPLAAQEARLHRAAVQADHPAAPVVHRAVQADRLVVLREAADLQVDQAALHHPALPRRAARVVHRDQAAHQAAVALAVRQVAAVQVDHRDQADLPVAVAQAALQVAQVVLHQAAPVRLHQAHPPAAADLIMMATMMAAVVSLVASSVDIMAITVETDPLAAAHRAVAADRHQAVAHQDRAVHRAVRLPQAAQALRPVRHHQAVDQRVRQAQAVHQAAADLLVLRAAADPRAVALADHPASADQQVPADRQDQPDRAVPLVAAPAQAVLRAQQAQAAHQVADHQALVVAALRPADHRHQPVHRVDHPARHHQVRAQVDHQALVAAADQAVLRAAAHRVALVRPPAARHLRAVARVRAVLLAAMVDQQVAAQMFLLLQWSCSLVQRHRHCLPVVAMPKRLRLLKASQIEMKKGGPHRPPFFCVDCGALPFFIASRARHRHSPQHA